MINVISVLIFTNLLPIIFTAETTTTLNFEVQNEEQAARILAEIETNEVLPLILFKMSIRKYGSKASLQILQFPENLVKTVTLNGKMVQGTTFSAKNSISQIFFCPEQNSKENCLVPQEFEEPELLRCAKEPDPILRKNAMESSCGIDNSGTSYDMIYRICPNDKEYETKDRPVYEFCYNTSSRKTLYTMHIILNPLLLVTKLLFRERTVSYPFAENDTLKPLNFEGIDFATSTDWNLLIHPEKPDYRIQKLVPDTDLAFALWRKPTYQSFNLDWQHISLIPLWNKINDYVKTKAIQMIRQNIAIHVRTLIYDITPVSEDKTIMSNIWVKIVTTIPLNPAVGFRGIVILMNNFIVNASDQWTDDDSTENSNTTEKLIETLCTNDYCVGSLSREFEKIGSRVRCCFLTSKLAKALGVLDIHAEFLPMLYITGINSEFVGVY